MARASQTGIRIGSRRALPPRRDELERAAFAIGELIDAAAFDPERWSGVADELQRASRAKVIIQAHDPSFGRPLVAVAAGWSSGYIEQYAKYFACLNDIAKEWPKKAPPMTPVPLPELVMPIERFLETEFYNDSLKPESDADCATGIRIFSDGGRQATLALQYALRHKDRMHATASSLLTRLAPRLRGALLANRNILRKQNPSLNTDLIHNLLDAALIVDHERRVLSANRLAQDFIASSDAVRISSRDILSLGSSMRDTKFAKLVREACQCSVGAAGYSDFSFEHAHCQHRFSIFPISQNLQSLTVSLIPLFAPSTVAMIIIRRIESAMDRLGAFQLRYHLTDAESRIVQALSRAGSLAQLAEELGIAYETARNHLKAAFAKTGTHSQREILQLLMRCE